MSVVRAWNQSKRCYEFGVIVGPASQDKYLYVRVTTGQTKRFRRDRISEYSAVPAAEAANQKGSE